MASRTTPRGPQALVQTTCGISISQGNLEYVVAIRWGQCFCISLGCPILTGQWFLWRAYGPFKGSSWPGKRKKSRIVIYIRCPEIFCLRNTEDIIQIFAGSRGKKFPEQSHNIQDSYKFNVIISMLYICNIYEQSNTNYNIYE